MDNKLTLQKRLIDEIVICCKANQMTTRQINNVKLYLATASLDAVKLVAKEMHIPIPKK